MNSLKNVLFYWRSNVLVFLGLFIAVTVCIGSLGIGDSAAGELQRIAHKRLGNIQDAIIMQGRFLKNDFVTRLNNKDATTVASVLSLRSLVSAPKTEKRHPRVLVHGVDQAFWSLAPVPTPAIDGLAINASLAEYLQVSIGDEIIVRVEKPSLMSRDAPLTPDDDALVTTRMPVKHILSAAEFGAFQLSANQDEAMNVFLPQKQLQEIVELQDWVNQVFFVDEQSSAVHKQIMDDSWKVTDFGITVSDKDDFRELQSEQIFIDDFIVSALEAETQAVLGYMVNSIAHKNGRTPYSIVAALDESLMHDIAPAANPESNDGIIVNDWLAEDLSLAVGDELEVHYFALLANNELEERSVSLPVGSIVPMEGLAADASLMPPFPGLAEKDDCREWDPGAHIELSEIRDKDEDYWDTYKGTPKAFIDINLGQELFGNRFGQATALRSSLSKDALLSVLEERTVAGQYGLSLTNIAELSQTAAAGGARYVSSVFISLHMFLIAAAILLVVLFLGIALQQRRQEMGILLSMGYTWKRLRRMYIIEQMWILLFSIVVGVLCAHLYHALLVMQLQGAWSGAIADAALGAELSFMSVLIGVVIVVVSSLLVYLICLRRFAKMPAQLLLRGQALQMESNTLAKPYTFFASAAVIGLLLAVVCLVFLPLADNDPVRFFAAAMFVLLAGLSAFIACARYASQKHSPVLNGKLSLLHILRSSRRYVMLIAVIASCVFLILASSAFRMDAQSINQGRLGPLGGFSLFGHSSLPIERNLNTSEGRQLYALDDEQLQDVHVVMMRANNEDETSCLNLNQSQTPRLWGVDWQYLNKQTAFPFMQSRTFEQSPWELLGEKRDGRIPVIGDVNSILWSLGKGLGSQFIYANDRGETIELEVVALLQDTSLQGGLLMDERFFSEAFPQINGYNYCMVDTGSRDIDEVAAILEKSCIQQGLIFEKSSERLQRYLSVRNAYIVIFQAIGSLGIALGCVGIAAIVLRHIQERRSELAIMRSFGFTMNKISAIIFWEHALTVLIAVAIGAFSALLAVVPVAQGFGQILAALLPLMLIIVVALVATAVATRYAMRGHIIIALRAVD